MPDGAESTTGPVGITVANTGSRPLTQAFHELTGTGEPGATLFIDLAETPWGTVDPRLGTPETLGGTYRPPRIDGEPDHIVQVGEDGRWHVDLGEVPDGHYWVIVDVPDGTAVAATTELKVWSSPHDRAQQRADRGLDTGPPTGPEPEPAPTAKGPPNDVFTVDAVGTEATTQAFHTITGTGVPGQELIIGVGGDRAAAGGGDPYSATHRVTVGDDGTWSIDLGELPDGDNLIQVQDARGLFTETGTIRVWSSPGARIEQQKANGVYVEPDIPLRYVAPDGSVFTEDDPPAPARPTEPPATETEPTSQTPIGMWWMAGAALLVLVLIAVFALMRGGDDPAPALPSPPGLGEGEPPDDVEGGALETNEPGQDAGSDTGDQPGPADDAPSDPVTAGFDYAVVPPGDVAATFAWTQIDGCVETPVDFEGALVVRSGSQGLRVALGPGAPRGAVIVGDGTVEATGFGGGGTTTRDGQRTRSTSRGEVLSVEDDGFVISAEAIRGPADEDGELIPGQEECTSGGVLTVTTDPAYWGTLLMLPTSEEPPIRINDFGCVIEPTSDGADLWFAIAADVRTPLPDQPFTVRLDVFGGGDISVEPDILGSSMADGVLFTTPGGSGPPPNLPPPAPLEPVVSQGPAVWGSTPFQPGASNDPDSLDSFTLDDLMDAQPVLGNGPFSAFGISDVCRVIDG